ncbi:hypothetical protein [Noviherbaspirillum humi]|uniref:hypothetical protein n=1 Tax=Noviherbaspirillum humi TaxID=1688639 RepID=UPI001FE4F0DF|nr:hypothetical protein [Noviherbaspirillum humi]
MAVLLAALLAAGLALCAACERFFAAECVVELAALTGAATVTKQIENTIPSADLNISTSSPIHASRNYILQFINCVNLGKKMNGLEQFFKHMYDLRQQTFPY